MDGAVPGSFDTEHSRTKVLRSGEVATLPAATRSWKTGTRAVCVGPLRAARIEGQGKGRALTTPGATSQSGGCLPGIGTRGCS